MMNSQKGQFFCCHIERYPIVEKEPTIHLHNCQKHLLLYLKNRIP